MTYALADVVKNCFVRFLIRCFRQFGNLPIAAARKQLQSLLPEEGILLRKF